MRDLVRDLADDLRHAVRVLVKAPRFSLTVILTLAIGIAVNAANFSIVNAFLLRPQPYEEPGELVHVWRTDRKWGTEEGRFSRPAIEEMAAACDGCREMGYYNYFSANLAGGDGPPQSIMASRVSLNLLPLLGTQPEIGRLFDADDVAHGRSVILGQGLWQRRFAGRQEAVGATLELNDERYTVIGVMPGEFSFPYGEVRAWVVIQPDAPEWDRDYRNFMPVVRLAEGARPEQVASQLHNTYRPIWRQHESDLEGDPQVVVEPLREALLFLDEELHLLMGLLTVASLFVLLIICTNIANLFLVRATGRRREVAIRAALGAGRLSLLRQLLAEGAVLALTGGLLGALLAHGLLRLAGPAVPEALYRVGDFTIDGTVLAFTLAISLVTVLLFALPPGLQALRTDLNLALKEGSAGSGVGAGSRRTQSALVVAQISLAVVLLVATVLAVGSFANLDGVDPGFDTDDLLTMGLTLPSGSFPEPAQIADFQTELVERVAALPGVKAAAMTAPLPMNFESWGIQFTIEGDPDPAAGKRGGTMQFVGPDYFAATGIALLAGREFEPRDDRDAPPVVVVNRALAERYWPGEGAVGRRIVYGGEDDPTVATIVGVVEDTKRMFLSDGETDMIYRALAQSPVRNPWLVVETEGDPLAMTAAVRQGIWSLRDGLPLSEVRSMRQVVDASLAPWRWSATVLGAFSLFALLLASIGIYGVVAYTTTQRTAEIGIRMAMGARPVDILRFAISKALLLTTVGVAVGAAASLALNRALASMLYGIGSSDPLVYLAVLAVLVAVTLAAALGPARRAARLEPSMVLRYE